MAADIPSRRGLPPELSDEESGKSPDLSQDAASEATEAGDWLYEHEIPGTEVNKPTRPEFDWNTSVSTAQGIVHLASLKGEIDERASSTFEEIKKQNLLTDRPDEALKDLKFWVRREVAEEVLTENQLPADLIAEILSSEKLERRLIPSASSGPFFREAPLGEKDQSNGFHD